MFCKVIAEDINFDSLNVKRDTFFQFVGFLRISSKDFGAYTGNGLANVKIC